MLAAEMERTSCNLYETRALHIPLCKYTLVNKSVYELRSHTGRYSCLRQASVITGFAFPEEARPSSVGSRGKIQRSYSSFPETEKERADFWGLRSLKGLREVGWGLGNGRRKQTDRQTEHLVGDEVCGVARP